MPDFVRTPAGFDILPSPYFFVPAGDQVWIPDDPSPSHDRPAKNGLVGTLTIRLTAKTALFIRGPGPHPTRTEEKRQNKTYQSFCTLPDGTPAIPGTSIGGMLRSVFEIITFSKFQPVPKRRFAVRDLKTQDDLLYKKWMTQITTVPDSTDHRRSVKRLEPTARAGWLRENSEGLWTIEPCEFARIEQQDLEEWAYDHSGTNICLWKRGTDKYGVWNSARRGGGEGLGLTHDLPVIPRAAYQHSSGKWLVYSRVDRHNNRAGHMRSGTLVFTGQPSDGVRNKRPVPETKHMEFFFHSASTKHIPVPESVKRDFLAVHCSDKGLPEGEWIRWNRKLMQGEAVPVFYLTKPDTRNETTWTFPDLSPDGSNLHAFGLSLMFRLAHAMSDTEDAAERVFGHIGNNPLRKRVVTHTLRAQGQPIVLTDGGKAFRTVVGSPRATFYPHYVSQPHATRGKVPDIAVPGSRGRTRAYYRHPMQDGFRLNGWKRYPVRELPDKELAAATVPPPRRAGRSENEDVCTWFRPLASGTEFEGQITFHNLLPWELGALLWALTLGRVQGEGNGPLCHSLGFGKALGLGAVEVSITGATITDVCSNKIDLTPVSLDSWLNTFEEKLRSAGILSQGMRLADHPNIRELLALADPARGTSASQVLRYPRSPRDFGHAKRALLCLPRYTEIFPCSVPCSPTRGGLSSGTPAIPLDRETLAGRPIRVVADRPAKHNPQNVPPAPKRIILVRVRLAPPKKPGGKLTACQEGVGVRDPDRGVVTEQPENETPVPGELWEAELVSPAPGNQNYRLLRRLE